MSKYCEKLKERFLNIGKLITTPDFIKDRVCEGVREVDYGGMKNTEKIKHDNLIRSIENISEQSLQQAYNIIYNQVCILAVSALGAVLERYFLDYSRDHCDALEQSKDIKLSLKEISKFGFDLKPNIGKIILDKDSSIKFQSFQHTIESIKKYFQKEIFIEESAKQIIIFYQQCRHVLVHKDGIVDEDFLTKVSDEANIKKYLVGSKVQLEKKDWEDIQRSFLRFIEVVSN